MKTNFVEEDGFCALSNKFFLLPPLLLHYCGRLLADYSCAEHVCVLDNIILELEVLDVNENQKSNE